MGMGIWTAWELPGFRLLRWLQALIWAFMPGVKDENRQNMVEKEEWEARMHQAETNGRAEMILTRFGDSILRYAYTYLHNMSDAEEVLQDTLVQFLKTAPEFESENHEKAWLLRVAANLSKNRIRYKPGPVFVYSKKGIIYSAGTNRIPAISGLLNRRNGSG